MNTFKLRILTTVAPFYSGNCEDLVFNTTDGKYGIKAHHRNMLGTVRSGRITFIEEGGKKLCATVSDGIIKIKNNRVVLLVETAQMD